MKREYSSQGPWALWASVCAVVLLLGVFLVVGPSSKPAASGKAGHPITRSLGGDAARGGEPALEPFGAVEGEPHEGMPPLQGARSPSVASNYGRLPLSFEANFGQSDGQVKFLSRGGGYTLFLTGNEAVLALRKSGVGGRQAVVRRPWPVVSGPWQGPKDWFRSLLTRPFSQGDLVPDFGSGGTTDNGLLTTNILRMKLVGANPAAKVTGLEELPGKSNYFIGNDPKKWRTNVPNYAKVKYEGVYPGIDLVYYGNQRQLEYDFVVAPGADPKVIALDVGAGLVPARGHPQGAPIHAQRPSGPLGLNGYQACHWHTGARNRDLLARRHTLQKP